MIRFGKVVVAGVGLIGGSFAAGLRLAGCVDRLVAVGRRPETLAHAKALGLIDEVASSVESALIGADIVLIAAPVAQTETILRSMAPHLATGTVITDAGSTKADVVAAARRALGAKIAQFVPGHPIAGRELNGPEAAIPDLYRGKKVILTPLPENSAGDVARVSAAWQACGAVMHQLAPADHDRVFAAVSHLPHLLAYALVDDIARKPHADLLFQYAASGFRDFTRIAGSSPEMWRDISLANADALLGELDAYLQALHTLRGYLVERNGAAIEGIYSSAQRARRDWMAAIEAAESQAKQGGD